METDDATAPWSQLGQSTKNMSRASAQVEGCSHPDQMRIPYQVIIAAISPWGGPSWPACQRARMSAAMPRISRFPPMRASWTNVAGR